MNRADNQLSNATVAFNSAGGRWAIWQPLGTSQSVVGIIDSTTAGIIENTQTQTGFGNGAITLTGAGAYSFNGYFRDESGGSGTLALTKNGSGTQTLAGANITYTGATTVNGGTLSLFNATGFNSATTVNNGAALQLAGNGNVGHAYALTLNDGSTLNKINTGWNTFNSSNVVINGTVAININNNGANNQLFIGGATTGLTGSGTINLTNTGSATTGLYFRGNDSGFSGTMNVNGGIVSIGSLAGLGNASLVLQSTALNLTNAARLNLAGAFAANATNGSVQSLSGDATATVTLGGQTLTIGTNNGTGANFAGVISGSGAVVKTGTGTQMLTGNNTYGATVVNGGTLFIGNGGTTGTLGTGAVTNNGALVFNRTNTMTVAGAIGGTGTVTQSGTGTTILAANNSYSGATTVSSGTLQAGAGGATGSLGTSDVAINAGATLQFFRNNSLTVVNNLSGTGALSFLGTGGSLQSDYFLTGNNSGFTGAVTVDRARLRFDNTNDLGASAPITVLTGGQVYVNGATLANPITLNGTGWLEPTGLLGALRLQSGAVVSGNVTLQSDSRITAYNSTGTISGVISGGGNLTKDHVGTLIFTGNNTYTGTTTISGGTLQVGSGGTSGSWGTGNVVNNAALVLNRSDAVSYGGAISGTGTLTKTGAGTLTLTGASTYTGATAVNAGGLVVNGSLGSTAVTAASGVTLGGSGTIAGVTTIAGGATLAPGASPGGTGALATGRLVLANTSILAYDLGAANVVGAQNDVVNVTGNLTLDGTLNVTDAGSFTTLPGSYRLINYTGTLTNNTLTVGTTPGYAPGEAIVQTAVAGRVNLIVSSGMNVAFWDGAGAQDDGVIAGGTQTWNNSLGNWTNVDGGFNQAWLNGMAVFEATAGTVTVGAAVQARALQFSTTGYVLASGGSPLQLNALASGGAPIVRVDPGVTATINVPISGTSGLNKVDTGTLVLAGINTYSGTTTISGGTLQIGNGGTTATLPGGPIVNNGALVINRSNAISMANAISGTGNVVLTGGGTLTLSGGSSYSGGTTVSRGVLQTASTTAAGTGAITLGDANTGASNVAWRIAGGNQPTNNVVVSANGTGAATLGGYSGGTFTIYRGNVQLDRDVIMLDGTGDRSSFEGVISGTGNITVSGTRVTIDNNANTGTGIITVNAGSTLQINANTAIRSNTAIVNNGTLRLNPGGGATAPVPVIQALSGGGAVNSITVGAANLSVGFNDTGGVYSGVIANGSGVVSLTKIGAGTQVLTGANAYTGTTTISGGTLQIGNGGTTGALGTGAITVDASLVFNRSNATTVANAIGGTGTVRQAGTGTTVLTGANTYATTLVSAGTLQIGSGGTIGTLGSGAVTNNASLVFNRSNALTVANTISGTGTLIQAGAGTTSLTGANTYTGTTTITGGHPADRQRRHVGDAW